MSLHAGARLGSYEVVSLVGAGGMGEVYQARDTKLDRDVAIKVLQDSLALDADRIARFEREAKALASLNHPNVAHIYGVEESCASRALVMELVEGPTLADRIAPGPIPIAEALPIAKQIAEALEAAHDQGIIHRDLKPANVKIRADGMVKVLDFGLARAFDPAPVTGGGLTNSPTLSMQATYAGLILGTAAYMSPEQAAAKPIDKRADIWSFGVVLWEMLTGRQLFSGETISHTLADVLRADIDFAALPPDTPPIVRDLLRRCLDRDVKRRLRDIGEARVAIDRAISESRVAAAPAARPAKDVPSSIWWRGAWMISAVTFAGLTAVVFWAPWRVTSSAPRPLIRLDVNLGVDAGTGTTNDVLISPDGTRIVFTVLGPTGTPQLATRLLDRADHTLLTGTENARFPFFSPDSQWLGFFRQGKLLKTSLQGGTPIPLCDARTPLGAGWGEGGYIVAALDEYAGGLSRVPESGGAPQPLTERKEGELQALPQVLPGGDAVLFTSLSSITALADSSIDVVRVKSRERTRLVDRGYFGWYVPSEGSTGHLLYVANDVLRAEPFDPSRLQTHGAAVTVLDGVGGRDIRRLGSLSASTTGVFVHARGGLATRMYPVVWLDSSGKTEPLLSKADAYSSPRVSPDGQRLVVDIDSDAGRDLWVYDIARDVRSQLTYDGNSRDGVWTPDGRHVIYWRSNPGGSSIRMVGADGAGDIVLLESRNPIVPTSLSPEGRLLYFEIDPKTLQDLWTLPIDFSDAEHPKPGKPEKFLGEAFAEFEPSFSPDGHWIAYRRSGASTLTEIFVQPFPGPGERKQISSGGGRNPMWSPDGRELFYENIDNRIAVVDYKATRDSFQASKPRVWADQQMLGLAGAYDATLAPDGKRFAVVLQLEATADRTTSSHATFLLNFFDELRRRAPAR